MAINCFTIDCLKLNFFFADMECQDCNIVLPDYSMVARVFCEECIYVSQPIVHDIEFPFLQILLRDLISFFHVIIGPVGPFD